MINLQARIGELMSKRDMKPSDIERKSNIPIKSFASVLNGTSKNPTIKTLKAIAVALDVTLEQMLSDELSNLDGLNSNQLQLYSKSCNVLIDTLITNNYQLPIAKISSMIQEIYEYSLESNTPHGDHCIDQKFIDWLLKKSNHLTL